MTADELEQLLTSLLAKGVTVVLLALGPAGELVGVEPGGSATPSVSSGQDAAGAPRPDLELGADGEVCVGSGGSSGAGAGTGSGGSGSGADSGSGSDSSGGGDRERGPGADGSGADGSAAGSGSTGAGGDPAGGSEDGRDGGSGGSDSSDGSGDSDDRRRAGGSDDSGSSGGSDDGGSGGSSSGNGGSEGTGSGGSGSGGSGSEGSGSDDSSPGDSDAGSDAGSSGSGSGGSGSGGTASGAPDESGATAYGTSDDAAAGLLTGGTDGRTTPAPCPTGSGDAADPAPATGSTPEAGGATTGGATAAEGTTAAAKLGWGRPVRADEFDNGTDGWSIYDGAGHAGNGRRTPDAAAVADGVLTITGDSRGNTAGMAWKEGSQQYGRWEGRVRAPVGDPSYNALLLLWPTAENWPEGGELDFMEMMDPERQKTNAFFHYGADNSQVEGSVEIDATQWHNWALEWTPDRITAYVDGEKWFETTEQKVQPPGPMHLCIQLDWFPKGGSGEETQMQVDWVRQYTLDSGAAGAANGGAADGGSATGSGGTTGSTG
ncbi:glycoside hydrolase family 16 protein [Pseudonocardia alni]|uniref:Beta-glucanase (GH16 family) n=1 Tax=Pseudonocardia alni TaxID=33907 RepID=A0AA44URS2_PSEA5|nr:glycoside hydrolase family 16 protein [Pseudonocardia alni]PKB32186.1 beta-glucanase (GH16 family) [Pseudonocardia alni]